MGVMIAPVDGSGSWPACRQTVLKRARAVSFIEFPRTVHALISRSPCVRFLQMSIAARASKARCFAQSTALEIQRTGAQDVAAIITRRQTNAAAQYPDMSMAVLPARRDCESPSTASAIGPGALVSAGPWAHVEAPRTVPSWI